MLLVHTPISIPTDFNLTAAKQKPTTTTKTFPSNINSSAPSNNTSSTLTQTNPKKSAAPPSHQCISSTQACKTLSLPSLPNPRHTLTPPLGHSLTIVGLEVRANGSRNLLVFDPMFKPSPGIIRLIGAQFRSAAPEKLLKAYRRGESILRKYESFEVLK